jgi:leader peptidase (prepilin peptidase)/N-methyltransferase
MTNALSSAAPGALLPAALTALGGAATGGGLLGALWLGTKGKGIGLGDVKLMIPVGMLFGAADTAVLLFVAFTVGGAVAAYLLAGKKAGLKSAIPFGPFLAGAALLLFLAPAILSAIKIFAFGGYL